MYMLNYNNNTPLVWIFRAGKILQFSTTPISVALLYVLYTMHEWQYYFYFNMNETQIWISFCCVYQFYTIFFFKFPGKKFVVDIAWFFIFFSSFWFMDWFLFVNWTFFVPICFNHFFCCFEYLWSKTVTDLIQL